MNNNYNTDFKKVDYNVLVELLNDDTSAKHIKDFAENKIEYCPKRIRKHRLL